MLSFKYIYAVLGVRTYKIIPLITNPFLKVSQKYPLAESNGKQIFKLLDVCLFRMHAELLNGLLQLIH